MTEPLRNTLVVGGIFMVIVIQFAIDWIREEMRK